MADDGYDWGTTSRATEQSVDSASLQNEKLASELHAKANQLGGKKKWIEAEKVYTEALDIFGLGTSDTHSLPSRRSLDKLSLNARHLVLQLFCNRATSYLARGLRQQGVADSLRACETDLSSPTAAFKLGFALQWSGKYNDAVDAYHKCIDLTPRSPSETDDQGKAKLESARLQAQGFRGTKGNTAPTDVLAREDQSEQGAEADRIATEVSFLKEAGNRAFKEKRYEEAVERYTRAIGYSIENSMTNAVLHCNRSAALMGMKEHKLAMEDARFAIKLKPDWHKSYLRYGAAVEALGRPLDAIRAYANCKILIEEADGIEAAEKSLASKKLAALEKETGLPPGVRRKFTELEEARIEHDADAAGDLDAAEQEVQQTPEKPEAGQKQLDASTTGAVPQGTSRKDGDLCTAAVHGKPRRNKVAQKSAVQPVVAGPTKEQLASEARAGHGMVTDKYRWMQTLEDVTLCIQLPVETKVSDVEVSITTHTISVGLKGAAEPLVQGFFYAQVKTDDEQWSIDDRKELIIQLSKINQVEWWPGVIKGDPELPPERVPANPRFDEDGTKVPELLSAEMRHRLAGFCESNPLPEHLRAQGLVG